MDYILLTGERHEFSLPVTQQVPGVYTQVIGANPHIGRLDGNIWCFVDWALPEISGLEMCRRLRAFPATAHSHITMVLDEDDPDARRRALKYGADDYVLGPLTPSLLIARIKEYRSTSSITTPTSTLSNGDLTLDLVAHRVSWCGRPVDLQPIQFRLLAHFMGHPNQVFNRVSLIAMLGKDGEHIDERTVDVWVGRLRRAIMTSGAPDPLRTVRSVGYVLDEV